MICSATSVKLPAQLAYLASTVVPRDIRLNRIGIVCTHKHTHNTLTDSENFLHALQSTES